MDNKINYFKNVCANIKDFKFKNFKKIVILWLVNSNCLKSDFLFNLCPVFKLCVSSIVLKRKKNKLENSSKNIKNFDEKTNLDLNEIKILLDKEIERQYKLEEKSKANLFAVTISITIGIGIFTSLFRRETLEVVLNSPVIKFSLVSFFIAVFYFLYGGYSALKSLRIREIHAIDFDNLINSKHANELSFKQEIIKMIELNRNITLRSTNLIDVSFVSIRNGIFLYSLTFLLMLVFLISM